jgi:hypothetical protein
VGRSQLRRAHAWASGRGPLLRCRLPVELRKRLAYPDSAGPTRKRTTFSPNAPVSARRVVLANRCSRGLGWGRTSEAARNFFSDPCRLPRERTSSGKADKKTPPRPGPRAGRPRQPWRKVVWGLSFKLIDFASTRSQICITPWRARAACRPQRTARQERVRRRKRGSGNALHGPGLAVPALCPGPLPGRVGRRPGRLFSGRALREQDPGWDRPHGEDRRRQSRHNPSGGIAPRLSEKSLSGCSHAAGRADPINKTKPACCWVRTAPGALGRNGRGERGGRAQSAAGLPTVSACSPGRDEQ